MAHRCAHAVAGVMMAGTAVLAPGQVGDAAANRQRALVNETFRFATADPRFRAFGAACLTGAPRGAAPPVGEHPLRGCTSTPVGPVPTGSASPFGYLQLTDANNDQIGSVLFDSPVPSRNGLEVTFEQWQYGNNPAVPPADGISFFLTDGAERLTRPGPFGGSLGYAQKLPDDNPANPFLPGVDHGYLGVGLDVLGNFFGDWEHRGNGCPPGQRSPAGTIFRVPAPGPNMVTVRGPGNGTVGYCFLTATTSNFSTTPPWPSTLPGQLQGPLTAIPPGTTPQQAQALLEPSKRTVRIRITPTPDPRVTIDLDFQDGRGFHRVLDFPAPEPVPSSFRFGFGASTGLFNDVHLIRNLTISAPTNEAIPRAPRTRGSSTASSTASGKSRGSSTAIAGQHNKSAVDVHAGQRHHQAGVNFTRRHARGLVRIHRR